MITALARPVPAQDLLCASTVLGAAAVKARTPPAFALRGAG